MRRTGAAGSFERRAHGATGAPGPTSGSRGLFVTASLDRTGAVRHPYPATSNGEVRIYLSTKDHVDLDHLKSLLGYGYASVREHHANGDPWEWVVGDPRRISSQSDFTNERDRLIRIFLAELQTDWSFELLYHPTGRASALYHWSSDDGWMFSPSFATPAT